MKSVSVCRYGRQRSACKRVAARPNLDETLLLRPAPTDNNKVYCLNVTNIQSQSVLDTIEFRRHNLYPIGGIWRGEGQCPPCSACLPAQPGSALLLSSLRARALWSLL